MVDAEGRRVEEDQDVSFWLRPYHQARLEAGEEALELKEAHNPFLSYPARFHRRQRLGQQSLGRRYRRRLERARLPYATRPRLLGLLAELAPLVPTALRRLLRHWRWRKARRRCLLSGSRPWGRLLRDTRWSGGPVGLKKLAWRYQKMAAGLSYRLASDWPIRPSRGRLVVRPTPEAQLDHHRQLQLEPELLAYLDHRTLSLILSPRRNNVGVILQPKLFRGEPGERIFERTAGQRSKFRGYVRRSYANRRGLMDDASFRLLRFHKKDRRFRFLEVTLKSFADTLGGRITRQPGRLQRQLKGLLFPFHRRQVSRRYPITGLHYQSFSTQPKGHPIRRKKHKRNPKLRAYLPW